MQDFWGICRRALKYRGTIIASFACSLLVGVLWGANIGTLYPLLEIVFSGESISESMDRKIAAADTESEKLHAEMRSIAAKNKAGEASTDRPLSDRQTVIETRLLALQKQRERLAQWKPWVDRFLPKDPFETLAIVIVGLLIASVLKGFFMASNEILVMRLTQLSLMDLRKRVYRHSLKLDVADFDQDRTSRLLSRITHDANRVGDGLRAIFGGAIREPLKIIACGIGAAIVSWRLLVIVMLVAPIAAVSFRWMHRRTKENTKAGMAATSDLYATIAESFGSIRIVKAYTLERPMRWRFHLASKSIYHRLLRLTSARAVIKPLVETIGMTAVSLALLVGAYLVLNQETHFMGIAITNEPMSPPTIMLFYAFLIGMIDPARKLSDISVSIQRSATAAEHVGRLLKREPEVRNPDRGESVRFFNGDIQFSGVELKYRNGYTAVSDINLEIKQRECVAIVGANGCGKSTLINMIPRFYDPSQGSITIGGTPLHDFSLFELRSRVGFVTQSTNLMDDTVLNNIRCAAPRASEEDAKAAARLVGAESFILDKLPEGYDTIVGEGHAFLSGGQAQRIALARAVLRDPDILILDEATSALDADFEDEVLQRLDSFIRGRTTVIITHRPAPLRLADRIVVMDGGHIVAAGTWKELSQQSDFIQRFDQHRRAA